MKNQCIDNLDRYVNQYLTLWDFFGVIQVIQKGEVVLEKSCGYACLEFDIKNNIKSRFAIASMSKQFTAFAIMILYDQKLIDIDKPANYYLPTDMMISKNITVHNLLSHTSGLCNFYNFENDFFGEDNRKNYSKDEYFKDYINKRPIQNPNESFDYNNSNYNLLAWIIENVSGIKYDEFIKINIFIPLNMTNSTVDNSDKIIIEKSFNYVMDYDTYIRCPFYTEKFSVGAGAIVSNCEDLYKWYLCLRDKKIISIESYTRFFSENLNHYCYGLEHAYIYDTNKFSHGGDHLGISTYMQNFFDEDICIIILSNNESINQYRLGNAISDILHDVVVDIPTKHNEIPINKNQIEIYCGTYLDNKIQIELIDKKLYFTRFKGNLHIEIYPVGDGLFARRYSDQFKPYKISFNENGRPQFFGHTKQKEGLIKMSFHIRVDARGIVINNGKILLNEFGCGEYYNIPGGGVEPGETVKQAVGRELLEETGLNVTVGDLIYVLEYKPNSCNFIYGEMTKISLVFRCFLNGDDNVKKPTIPDINPDNQKLISKPKWVEISNLENINYVPYIHKELIEYIKTNRFSPIFIEEPLANNK